MALNREEAQFQKAVRDLFNTNDGQFVLEELQAQYCRKMFNENPYRMAHNCGQSDVVMLLKQITEEREQ